ncbi:hypothetical protein HII36_25460 [Nonomuraea sp. NN258]|uniref:hypothetical protein n=1 Tax=Nonomuraea antri TaxID=2730852 RepID=UPI001567F2C4|nr:hypothetical protein [Nonomuraea antri]NRQ35148.1 hypothetical protein [Nonomuraea antri]
MRGFGQRGRVLALTAGLLAAATACTSAPAPTPTRSAAQPSTPAARSSAAAEPLVTPKLAAKIFAEVTLPGNDLALATTAPAFENRVRMAVELVRDGQLDLTKAAYATSGSRPPQRVWGRPTFLIPRFAPGEKAPWFSALVTRDGQQTLLTFRGPAWALSSAAQLLPGAQFPQVKLDDEGYATALPPDDKSITISPRYMGPVHAAVAEAGAKGPTAGLISEGPYTTEIAGQITDARDAAKLAMWSYDSIFSPDTYPAFALRTTDGGALIQYSLSRRTTMENRTDSSYHPRPVPESARWAVGAAWATRGYKFTEVHQYAVAVPPSTAPRPADLIAHDGGVTQGSKV